MILSETIQIYNFCLTTLYWLLNNGIWNQINDLKYTNKIPAQLFISYLLFYMEPDMISIIISGIKYTNSL